MYYARPAVLRKTNRAVVDLVFPGTVGGRKSVYVAHENAANGTQGRVTYLVMLDAASGMPAQKERLVHGPVRQTRSCRASSESNHAQVARLMSRRIAT